MAGNPASSKWYVTPQYARRRKRLEVTLCADALQRLGELANESGRSRSEILDVLILRDGAASASQRAVADTAPVSTTGDTFTDKGILVLVQGMKAYALFPWITEDRAERARFAATIMRQALLEGTQWPWHRLLQSILTDHLTENVHPMRVVGEAAGFLRSWGAWTRKRSRVESAQALALDAAFRLFLREGSGKAPNDAQVRALARAAGAISKTAPLRGEKIRSYTDLVGWVRNNCNGTAENLRFVVGSVITLTRGVHGAASAEVRDLIVDHLWSKGVHKARRDLVREDLTKSARSADHEALLNAILRLLQLEPPRSGARKV